MHYHDYIIKKENSVSDAMQQLEKSGHKIVFVACGAEDDILCGVLTDGDIRRYLLSGLSLSAPVMDAASKDPICVTGYHEAKARAVLKERDISCVPMVDENGRAHAFVFSNETVHLETAPIDTPVIVMAGGLGTRLYPYTEILPKPLIPVGKVTITEHILNRFKKFGCYDFHLVVNHKRNLIKSYFSEIDTGANLTFVDEDVPLGTGGGLSFFKGQFDQPVLVTYCDAVIEADYAEILKQHKDQGNIFTMVCAKKTITVPYGVIESSADGEMLSLLEKPRYELLTNTGLYVVSPEFIEMVPDNTFLPITDLVETCRKAGKRVGVYAIEEECFIDIGQLEDLHGVEGKLI